MDVISNVTRLIQWMNITSAKPVDLIASLIVYYKKIRKLQTSTNILKVNKITRIRDMDPQNLTRINKNMIFC